MIKTFGGTFRSQSEKYSANGAESISEMVSEAMDTPYTGTAFEPLGPSIG